MRAAIVRPSELVDDVEPVDLAIVVDVLRATTTATVLCARLGELCVIRSPAELAQLPVRAPGYALFSELTNLDTVATADIPRFDNSPVAARDAELGGRTPVLVTTNGTIAVALAARFAREVVLAGFLNLGAVVDYVQRRAVASVIVIPAGNIPKDLGCVEDDGCATALLARLTGQPVDVAALIAGCHADERIVRRRAREPGLAADMELCFAVDGRVVVPRATPHAGWFAVADAVRSSPA